MHDPSLRQTLRVVAPFQLPTATAAMQRRVPCLARAHWPPPDILISSRQIPYTCTYNCARTTLNICALTFGDLNVRNFGLYSLQCGTCRCFPRLAAPISQSAIGTYSVSSCSNKRLIRICVCCFESSPQVRSSFRSATLVPDSLSPNLLSSSNKPRLRISQQPQF